MIRSHQIISGIIALVLIIVIVYLVRQRKLREEYSWLWLLTGTGILFLSLSKDFLRFVSEILGITQPNALFLLSVLFLVALGLQFSVKLSELTNQVKRLGQESALKSVQSGNQQGNSKATKSDQV